MKKTIAALAIATLAATGLSAPAFAKNTQTNMQAPVVQIDYVKRGYRDDRGYRQHRLSHRDIYRSLHRMGFRDIGPLREGRGVYITHARGYRGMVRLVVDARNGHLISRELIRRYERRDYHGNRWDHGRRYGQSYGGSNGGFSWSLQIR